jgi:alpha-1,3-glucan synthase
MLHQFKEAVKDALASDSKTRREMRARSAKQRFPVAQWVQDLETLQTTAIKVHRKEAGGHRNRSSNIITDKKHLSVVSLNDMRGSRDSSRRRSSAASDQIRNVLDGSQSLTRGRSPSRDATMGMGLNFGPGHDGVDTRRSAYEMEVPSRDPSFDYSRPEEYGLNRQQMAVYRGSEVPNPDELAHALRSANQSTPSINLPSSPSDSPENSRPGTPRADESLLPPPMYQHQMGSNLSLDLVVGGKKDFSLQKVDPTFTDSNGEYSREFEAKLANLSVGNSEKNLAIETYLMKSEKEWFKKFRAAKLARSPATSPEPKSRFRLSHSRDGSPTPSMGSDKEGFQSLLGDNYKRPSVLKRFVQYRILDWPIYSLFLALGQILAATSYQITLISGQLNQDQTRFYTVAGIYLVASGIWWLLYRFVKSIYVLSTPFLLYGVAFLLLGIAPLFHGTGGKAWLLNVATGLYAFASASGALFFALNFGDEGGSPIRAWVFRCCIIQGTQQIYVCGLWFWGDYLSRSSAKGAVLDPTTSIVVTYVMIPIAAILISIGALLFISLPTYYRQDPGKVPSFYASLFRRNIILVSSQSFPPFPIPTNVYFSVVLRNNHNPIRHSLPFLRPYLAIPLLIQPRHNPPHHLPRSSILHHPLGFLPPPLLPPLNPSSMDYPPLRYRPPCPPLGPNIMERLSHRLLPPLGILTPRIRTPRPLSLALAWSPRCNSRRRFWHDTPADAYKNAHLCYPHCCANSRYGNPHACTGYRNRDWTPLREFGCIVSKFRTQGCLGTYESGVLGRSGVAGGHLFGFCGFLSKGAVAEAVNK